MKTVYFEDIWEEIITAKGFRLFEKQGYKLESGLFRDHPHELSDLEQVDLIIATKPDLSLLESSKERGTPIIFYAIFPDLLTGWNYDLNTYKDRLNRNFENKLGLVDKILVNSNFTKKLISTRTSQEINMEVCYLGVDSKSIAISMPERNGYNTNPTKKPTVLWNHMWRKEKGFTRALSIIFRLAQKYPKVDFIIGRKEFWGGQGVPVLKREYQDYLDQIEKKALTNIFFQENKYPQEKYWEFLNTVDISFSCSRHETFGISMLEQQAAGIACVVPSIEAYPEIHQGSLLVPLQQVESGIEGLITNKEKRAKIVEAGRKNAEKYTTEGFVDNLCSHMREALSMKQ